MSEDAFGLGFDTNGKLSHFIWVTTKEAHGPYRVEWLGLRKRRTVIRAVGVAQVLSDQLYSVKMMEPPEIQLQSLLQRPFRTQAINEEGKHAAAQETYAWYQLRILDVPACVSAVQWLGEPLRFQLCLEDPLQALLQSHQGWQGVPRDYVVELGQTSSATSGEESNLPVLNCSVNALSRLLWEVVPRHQACA